MSFPLSPLNRTNLTTPFRVLIMRCINASKVYRLPDPDAECEAESMRFLPGSHQPTPVLLLPTAKLSLMS